MAAARGSEKLLARESFTLTQKHVDQIQSLVQKYEGKFVHWWVLGQPAPDVLVAGVHVKDPASVGKLVTSLLGSDLRINLEVFPYGIPFPDIYRVNLRVGEQR